MIHGKQKITNGFTLVEVLVGLALLAGIALIVSQILSQGQKVVTISEERIRQNAAASALAGEIRGHLRKATRTGMFGIAWDNGNHPRMVFTTAGPASSVTDDSLVKTTSSVVVLGLANNAAAADPNKHLLWMPQYVLGPVNKTAQNDVWNRDLAAFQSFTPTAHDANMLTWALAQSPPLSVPCDTLAQAMALWQVPAINITRLSVQWTDGSAQDGNLAWFGYGIDGDLRSKDATATWQGRIAAPTASPYPPEYKSGAQYRVLWTNRNQNNWPKAIRVRFRIASDEPAMPPELRETDYEIIESLGP
jgi:prepilin-type N-terminal cleavage/methylation domain-containing protein